MNNLNKINSNSRAMRRGRSLSRSNSPYSKEDDSSAINDLRISAIENSKLKNEIQQLKTEVMETNAKCKDLEMLVLDKKLLNCQVTVSRINNDEATSDIVTRDEATSDFSEDSSDEYEDSPDKYVNVNSKKVCVWCKKVIKQANITIVCCGCRNFHWNARLISTKIDITPIKHRFQDFTCTCNENKQKCLKCKYKLLDEYRGKSRSISHLEKKQKEACEFCEIEYSVEYRHGFYYCLPCRVFLVNIGSYAHSTSIQSKTTDKLRTFDKGEFLAKFLATKINEQRRDDIIKMLNNECEDIINKFNRPSIFHKKKKNIIIQVLNHIKTLNDQKEIEFFLGLYLLIITSCRPGYESQSHIGIYTLRCKNIELKTSGTDFIINLNFVGKAAVPFQRSFKIVKLVYEKLELSIRNTTTEFVFDYFNTDEQCKKYWYQKKLFAKVMVGLTARIIRTSNANEFFLNQLKDVKKENLNVELKACLRQVQYFLNHEEERNCVEAYLDPRIFAAFCVKNKIKISQIDSDVYFRNRDWTLALESMEEFKDYEF